MIWLFSFLFVIPTLFGATISHSTELQNDTRHINIAISPKLDELIYHEFLTIDVDHPSIALADWHAKESPRSRYDESFKDNRLVYTEPINISITAQKNGDGPFHDAAVHVMYHTNQEKSPQHYLIPLNYEPGKDAPAAQPVKQAAAQKEHIKKEAKSVTKNVSWSEWISSLLKKADSLWIQLLLVFLLGLMLSLTPCIYPMIPITIGILQAQGSKSFIYNFLVSLLYTCGMATTFAIFGLLASCVGPLCGKLLIQPAFVIAFVVLLGYFAFSMFGFYDMYVPSFMNKQNNLKGGSLLTVFLFGALSGTIASPCVSPGLALVLTVAAALGNSLLGFVLLFFFGIGLSMPLLIVGTFSSSINMLPQAGMWMIEVKRLFGFMILAMCFYYLSYITPLHILYWLMAAAMIIVGLFYSKNAQKTFGIWKPFNQILGIALIAGSVVVSYYGAKEYMMPAYSVCSSDTEQLNYECARELALKDNKKMFIDCWATFCPVCIAINKKVLPDPTIKKALEGYVILKVDGTYDSQEPFTTINKKFNVTGFPTFLIVDPKTEEVLAHWGSEIYDMKRNELAELLYGI